MFNAYCLKKFNQQTYILGLSNHFTLLLWFYSLKWIYLKNIIKSETIKSATLREGTPFPHLPITYLQTSFTLFGHHTCSNDCICRSFGLFLFTVLNVQNDWSELERHLATCFFNQKDQTKPDHNNIMIRQLEDKLKQRRKL